MNKKRLTILPMLLFLFVFLAYGQKKIIYKGDTLIAITPSHITAINTALVENISLKKEVVLKDSIIVADSILLDVKDSIIAATQKREEIKEQYYIKQGETLAKENKKLKEAKKRSIVTSILSGAGGVIVGLLVGIILL